MEYFIPTQRQSPILPLLQMRQYMQRPQQHQNQNPFAQFMGMQQPNALSQYLQPEAGFNPGMAWWMRQRQGRQGAPDMLPLLWAMRRGGLQQQGGVPSDDPWRF